MPSVREFLFGVSHAKNGIVLLIDDESQDQDSARLNLLAFCLVQVSHHLVELGIAACSDPDLQGPRSKDDQAASNRVSYAGRVRGGL